MTDFVTGAAIAWVLGGPSGLVAYLVGLLPWLALPFLAVATGLALGIRLRGRQRP